MAVIKVLDHNTVDKIAAGEVVERPSSVVKELVENAIDAKASAITVEIKEGGVSLIRVTDNGGGIEKEQVPNAFLRHATSKITKIEDLLAVSSLGFRGEALSSIAAVSQVELITKTPEELTGIHYQLDGGVKKGLEEIGAPEGTTILVKNLFYNTPARRKFLKSAAAEGNYISDLMEHMAMSKPHVSFQYIQNGQCRFNTSGNGDLHEIIYRIYGKDIAANLIPVSAETEGISLKGYIGKPVITRANRNYENYFVNNRYIKSDMLAKGIEEGYKTYLMQHKYPFTALHLTIDSVLLDVNVHPSKMDIRIQNQPAFYEFLVRSISDALQEKELIQEITLVPEEKETSQKTSKAPEPFEAKRTAAIVSEDSVYHTETNHSLQNPLPNKIIGAADSVQPDKNENIHANILKQAEHIFVEKPEQLNFFDEKILTKEARMQYRILGQIFDTYWLIVYGDKLLIVDQHAAHEKIKYEKMTAQLRNKETLSQSLNPPVILSLSGKEESVLEEYIGYFNTMGFEIEAFGGKEYALRSVPLDLYGCDERQMFLNIMDELSEAPIKGTPEVIYEKLASMSCKAAVKGNMSLSTLEMEALLDELMELDNPYHCPHGRPTIISMSKYEIEKKFKRVL